MDFNRLKNFILVDIFLPKLLKRGKNKIGGGRGEVPGRNHERNVYKILENMGYLILPNKPVGYANLKRANIAKKDKLFLRQMAYNNLLPDDKFNVVALNYPYTKPIKGTTGRSDFVINDMSMKIEARFQNVNGSVEEKLEIIPSRLNNNSYKETKLVLVVDGDMFTESYINEIQNYFDREVISGKTAKIIHIQQFKKVKKIQDIF